MARMEPEGDYRRQQEAGQAQRDAESSLAVLRNLERTIADMGQRLPSSAQKTRRFLDDERNRIANQAQTLETLISKQRLTGVGGFIGRIESAVAPITRAGKAFEDENPRALPTFKSGGMTWTVDSRLREFRSVEYGKTPKFVPFDSVLGKRLMQAYDSGNWRFSGASEHGR